MIALTCSGPAKWDGLLGSWSNRVALNPQGITTISVCPTCIFKSKLNFFQPCLIWKENRLKEKIKLRTVQPNCFADCILSMYLYTLLSKGTDYEKTCVLTVLSIFTGLIEWSYRYKWGTSCSFLFALSHTEYLCSGALQSPGRTGWLSGAAFCTHPRAHLLLLTLLPGDQRPNCTSEGNWMSLQENGGNMHYCKISDSLSFFLM